MLTYKQLRHIKAARPFTDYSMLAGNKLLARDGWWCNGFALFYEDTPKKIPPTCEVGEPKPEVTATLQKRADNCTTQIWPVGIRPFDNDDSIIVIRLSNGDGATTWANARYLTALMKRAGKRKEATFYTDRAGNYILAKCGDTTLGLLAFLYGRNMPDNPAWSLRNEDVPHVPHAQVKAPEPEAPVVPKPSPPVAPKPKPSPPTTPEPKQEPPKDTGDSLVLPGWTVRVKA